MKSVLVLIFIFFHYAFSVREGFKGYPQDWGFVEVRPGAHSFWWLHYTLANVTDFTERPLIIWLQGGPGGSSSGYGNFEILGPVDLDFNERESTWIKNYNILFIDNPVGTGFSWVENATLLTTDNHQIARDLVELMRGFYEVLPEFKTVPLHIFGQSYGPKMGVEFAYELHKEIEAGTIESNLVSVGIGNAFISPIDSTLSWSEFLRQMGFVDYDGAKRIHESAMTVQGALDKELYQLATDNFFWTQFRTMREVFAIDFYNVLYRPRWFESMTSDSKLDENSFNLTLYKSYMTKYEGMKPEKAASLGNVMAEVHRELNLPPNVRFDSFDVFTPLEGDFMKPVVNIVEKLLNETSIKVAVYTGNVDLICATPGTMAWIKELNWAGKEDFYLTRRYGFGGNDVLDGYSRKFENLEVYWIIQAGHSVNVDNPNGMNHVLSEVIGRF